MGKAQQNVAADYAKHLRPYNKRKFWRKVRRIAKVILRKSP